MGVMIVEEVFWKDVSDAMKQGIRVSIVPIHQSATTAKIRGIWLKTVLVTRRTKV
jgi:hypothetical protein